MVNLLSYQQLSYQQLSYNQLLYKQSSFPQLSSAFLGTLVVNSFTIQLYYPALPSRNPKMSQSNLAKYPFYAAHSAPSF